MTIYETIDERLPDNEEGEILPLDLRDVLHAVATVGEEAAAAAQGTADTAQATATGAQATADTAQAAANDAQDTADNAQATAAAANAGLAGKEDAGTAATLDAIVEQLLRDGVPTEGDTLQKLYNLIQMRAIQYNVPTIAARNATSVRIGAWVNVDDDGDGRWAIYRATSSGTNASFVKVSDPDLLNAAMTAAQIKLAYESNPDTNAFTNAFKSLLQSLVAVATSGSTNDLSEGTKLFFTEARVLSTKLTSYVRDSAYTAVVSGTTTLKQWMQQMEWRIFQNATLLPTAATTITAAYTLALTDAGSLLEVTSASDLTLTIPTDASVAFPLGTVLEVAVESTGVVTVVGASGVTLTAYAAGTKSAGQYTSLYLRKRAANAWRVNGGAA